MRIGRAQWSPVLVRVLIFAVPVVAGVSLARSTAALADQEKVLWSFCSATGCSDGETPEGVIMDGAGNLYGTTSEGGAGGAGCQQSNPSGCGTVFELIPNASGTQWTETVLYSFCPKVGCADGAQPAAGLIIDKSGNLYGTTFGGGEGASCQHIQGCGTVFELTPNRARTQWTETVLYSFCAEANCGDGLFPSAGLIMDNSGNLYGTSSGGGQAASGVVFELSPNAARTQWTETVLYSFCAVGRCSDGAWPAAGLIIDNSGNLYGTTEFGGAGFIGAVFELSPNAARTQWRETVLYSFGADGDGAYPLAGLIMDKSGNLYGTNVKDGGKCGVGVMCGTVFELIPNRARTKWTETVLQTFCTVGHHPCPAGSVPEAGLIMDNSGNLYGTTILASARP